MGSITEAAECRSVCSPMRTTGSDGARVHHGCMTSEVDRLVQRVAREAEEAEFGDRAQEIADEQGVTLDEGYRRAFAERGNGSKH